MKGRGIELLIQAVEQLNHVGLIILGNGREDYLEHLRNLAKEHRVENKVLFHPAVPITELWKFVGAADVSTAPIELVAKNHYYSLPNKFFESIQSLTPIIASAVPEMKRIIDKYEIGLTCEPGNVEEICRCIERLRTDKALYRRCKENLAHAKEDLCWENEKHILIKAFQSM